MKMNVLMNCGLFRGLNEEDIEGLLDEMEVSAERFHAGETILWQGDRVDAVGVVLSGTAQSLKTDLHGNTQIVTKLEAGSLIGVLLAASRGRKSPVAVKVTGDMELLWIPFGELMRAELTGNICRCLAERAMVLHDRIDCLVRPSVREKVLAYLQREAQGAREVLLTLDRREMAQYLNVERSALSRELSNMRADGLIEYRKNRFVLCRTSLYNDSVTEA